MEDPLCSSSVPLAAPHLRNDKAMVEAARVGNMDEVKRLQRDGVSLASSDGEGYTALMAAISEGHLSIFQYLISSNAGLKASPNTSLIRHANDPYRTQATRATLMIVARGDATTGCIVEESMRVEQR
jgi:ankyrin repeat protein